MQFLLYQQNQLHLFSLDLKSIVWSVISYSRSAAKGPVLISSVISALQVGNTLSMKLILSPRTPVKTTVQYIAIAVAWVGAGCRVLFITLINSLHTRANYKFKEKRVSQSYAEAHVQKRGCYIPLK